MSCFDPIHCPDFGTDFLLGKKGIWTIVLHGNYSYICKIDVSF